MSAAPDARPPRRAPSAERAPPRRAPGRPRQVLRWSHVRTLLKVEGRRCGSLEELSGLLGLTRSAACRSVRALWADGVARCVTLVDPARLGRSVECVARLKLDWSRPGAAETLEPCLREDPCVTEAAAVMGVYDYVAYAAHAGHAAAAEWARRLEASPGVSVCRVDLMRTRFKRFSFGAAIFGPRWEAK